MAMFVNLNLGTKAVREAESERSHIAEAMAIARTRPRPSIILQQPPVGDIIYFNIRGSHFQCPQDLLRRAPLNSILNHLDSEPWVFLATSGEHSLDRMPAAFQAILVYLATFQLHLPPGMCRQAFADELLVYGLDISLLSPCCRPALTKRQRLKLQRAKERSMFVRQRWRTAIKRALIRHRIDSGTGTPLDMCARLSCNIFFHFVLMFPYDDLTLVG